MSSGITSPLKVFVSLPCLINWEEECLKRFKARFPQLKCPLLENCSRPDIWDNFKGRKLKAAFAEILEDENFCQTYEPREGALWALHAMRTQGCEVRIVVPYLKPLHLVSSQLKWIHDRIGQDWLSYCVCSPVRNILICDVLIDVHPAPEQSVAVPWKHIVFDRPYNKGVFEKARMTSWAQWKSLLGLDEVQPEQDRPHWEHGSENSADKDIVYLFDALPVHRDCVKFCHGNEEDRNLIVISEGVVSASFKGPTDEVNNGLIATVPLHTQTHPLPLHTWMKRVVPVKVCIALRGLAVKLRKTRYRETILPLMGSSDFNHLLAVLKQVDFRTLKEDSIEVLKYCAFQMGQAQALIEGKEVYTKLSLAEYFPELRPFLLREPASRDLLDTLERFKDKFFESLSQTKVRRQGTLNIFLAETPRPGNFFELQSCGLVIDMEIGHLGDQLACFVFEWPSAVEPTWPLDKLPLETGDDRKWFEVFFWAGSWQVLSIGAPDSKACREITRQLSEVPLPKDAWYGGYWEASGFKPVRRRHRVTLVLDTEQELQRV